MPSNNEIRYSILQHLYRLHFEDPSSFGIARVELLRLIGTQENLMDSNMLYLEEKGLVRLEKVMGSLWAWARVTALGIDVIENKEMYKQRFPFITVQIQEIHGDVHGNVVQAEGSQVTIQQIDGAFQTARSMTESKTDISQEVKKEIQENLVALQEEIEKKEPDAGKIQRSWSWLKRNANWVVPVLAQIVSEVVKSLY